MKHFHSFRLDTTNQCLWRGDERVPLAPKAFDLLRYLVEHGDRLVPQEEILEALWTDTYVNPEVVKKYILGIRKVLGDRPEKPEFIRTFPKRGYQFIAPVTDDRETSAARPAHARPLIDRGAARAQLETCLEQAQRGVRQVVFVTGEAGVGKTTFVDLFVRRVALRPDVRIGRGQCIETFGGQEAYYPVLEAVDQLVRRSDDERLLQLLRKGAPTWLLQFPALVKADQRDALQRETIGATRERMVREICEVFEAIGTDRVLIVVLEDVHWADLATLDVVSTFARRREPARVLVVATQRPSVGAADPASVRLQQDLAIRGLCESIALDAFERTEVSEYLALEFDHATFATDLSSAIHRHSGGNALFVSAVVRELVADGVVRREGDTWKLTTPVDRIEPGVPASLQDMLRTQFDQLSTDEQRALRSASVIGDRFAAWTLAADGGELEHVEAVCERLAERRRFIRSAGIAELPNGTMSAFYEFHHSLYRQAIYRLLSEVVRSKLHRAAAGRLAMLFGPESLALAPQLAMHFELAHDYERAVQYLMLTAANAVRRFAVRDSLDVLQQAMRLVPRLPPERRTALEVEILERIGDDQYALGAMVESAQAYETESELAGRAGLTAAQVRAQTCFARPLGLLQPDRAIAVLQEAAKASVALADPMTQARVELLAAGTRIMYKAWDAEDFRVCEAAADRLARGTGDTTTAGFDRMVYAHVQAFRGDAVAALGTAEAGIPKSHETVGVMVQLFALSAQILAFLQLGRFGDALRIIRASQESAQKNGSDPWLFLYREAWLRTVAMDFAGAQRVCQELLDSSVYPTGQAQTIARVAAGFQALDEGAVDRARHCFDEVRDPAATPNFFAHWYWRVHAHVGATRAALQAGDVERAAIDASELTRVALSTDDPNLHALAWEARAQVAMAESEQHDAAQYLDRAFAALTRFDAPISTWRVHAAAWDLYRRTAQLELAATHRASACVHVTALAESFPPGEPLRDVLLSAPAVRRLREDEVEVGPT
ncbi:MAG TPA: AAA family ATPase [Vicinamibacterales bacterium]|jgi:DNA-binding winged helix-turn-helix (wHTH) protein|nr:AAA family ATPase [Vicinamibacterales bacterium]